MNSYSLSGTKSWPKDFPSSLFAFACYHTTHGVVDLPLEVRGEHITGQIVNVLLQPNADPGKEPE